LLSKISFLEKTGAIALRASHSRRADVPVAQFAPSGSPPARNPLRDEQVPRRIAERRFTATALPRGEPRDAASTRERERERERERGRDAARRLAMDGRRAGTVKSTPRRRGGTIDDGSLRECLYMRGFAPPL